MKKLAWGVAWLWWLFGWQTVVAAPVATEMLRGFYRDTPHFEGQFTQQQFDDQARPLAESKGKFVIARPLRFRWEYQSPQKQVLVSDGKLFRLYDVDLAQVTERPVTNALKGAPLRLLMEGDALEREFALENEGDKQGLRWVRLVPRNKTSDFTKIRIGLADGLPRRLELSDQLGQTTRIQLDQVRKLNRVDAQRFTLTLPAGVEIVGTTPPNPTLQTQPYRP